MSVIKGDTLMANFTPSMGGNTTDISQVLQEKREFTGYCSDRCVMSDTMKGCFCIER